MRRPMNRNGGASVLNQWASGTGSEWWVELSPSGRRALGVFYLKENAVVDSNVLDCLGRWRAQVLISWSVGICFESGILLCILTRISTIPEREGWRY